MTYKDKEIKKFLKESNAIEREYSDTALNDALKAWKYLERNAKNGITTKSILKIHGIMLKRLNPRIAGKYRECDVWIGGNCKKFISKGLLKSDVRTFLDDYRLNSRKLLEIEKEEICKKSHIQFEFVHPFEDGNGRVGRILYLFQRMRLGLLIHIIHEGKEQMEYYKWFKN